MRVGNGTAHDTVVYALWSEWQYTGRPSMIHFMSFMYLQSLECSMDGSKV